MTRRLRSRTAAFGLLIASLVLTHGARAQAVPVAETAKSEAALLAIQTHWSDAEAAGDTVYLSRLLRPEYRSVNVDGTALSRAMLIAHAEAHRGSDAAVRALAEWRRTHHHGTHVVIDGETAVMSYFDPALGVERGTTSSDIFVYADHRWQALYSSHTAAHLPTDR